jgi:hypothetical protein
MHAATSKLALVTAAILAWVPAIGGAAGWTTAESPHRLMTPLGEYVLVGGGVNEFAESAVNDNFDMGGTWNLRLGIGSRSFVGAEVAYVGSIRSAKASDNDLTTHGAEGILRLQYPYVMGSWLVEPFAFGGIGWTRFSIDNAPAGAKDSDDIGIIPFGGGIMLGYGQLLLDARFSYNATFSDEDLVLSSTGQAGDLQNWAVIGSLGYEF